MTQELSPDAPPIDIGIEPPRDIHVIRIKQRGVRGFGPTCATENGLQWTPHWAAHGFFPGGAIGTSHLPWSYV